MRVAFWHFYTFRMHRGIETLVVSLANALAQKAIEVSIVTAKPTIQRYHTQDRSLVPPAEVDHLIEDASKARMSWAGSRGSGSKSWLRKMVEADLKRLS